MGAQQINPLDLIHTGDIDQMLGQEVFSGGRSFGEMVLGIISGEVDLSFGGIFSEIIHQLFLGLVTHVGLMQQLIFVTVLAAVLKILTDSFETKSVGEMGFYACYLLLVVTLLGSFYVVITIASDMLGVLTQFIRVTIPIIVSLMVMSGNITSAYTSNTLILLGINVINTLVVTVVLPFVIFVVTIQVINYLTDNEMLSNLAALFKKTITWGTKLMATGFIGIFTLNRVAAPVVNNLAINTARSAVNAVPVVGGALVGAVDTVMHVTTATKTGVIVAAVVAIVYLCLIPIVKLTAMMVIYKVVAALVQPITDKRMVKCLNAVGDFTGIVLGICVLVMFMFILSFIILVPIS